MPTIDLNFGSVGGLPEEGQYLCKITKAEVQPTKAGDSTNLVVDFAIAESDNEMDVNFPFKSWFSLKEAALWNLQSFLEAVTGNDWQEDSMELDPDDLIGQTVTVDVSHNEYNGRVNLSADAFYAKAPVLMKPTIGRIVYYKSKIDNGPGNDVLSPAIIVRTRDTSVQSVIERWSPEPTAVGNMETGVHRTAPRPDGVVEVLPDDDTVDLAVFGLGKTYREYAVKYGGGRGQWIWPPRS